MKTSPKARGTRWESFIVKQAEAFGLSARRLAEGGVNDLGDVEIQLWPTRDPARQEAALLWKRLVSSGGSRRRPDGAPAVAVLQPMLLLRLLRSAQLLRRIIESSGESVVTSSELEAEAAALLDTLPDTIIIEAKAREVLNVTRTLADAERKVDEWSG